MRRNATYLGSWPVQPEYTIQGGIKPRCDTVLTCYHTLKLVHIVILHSQKYNKDKNKNLQVGFKVISANI